MYGKVEQKNRQESQLLAKKNTKLNLIVKISTSKQLYSVVIIS